MKNLHAEFLGRERSPRSLGIHEWVSKPYQLFDANRWTVDVEHHFPELIAEEYQLLWAPLPHQLFHFRDAFEKSRQLLELPDDWDENGSSAFTEQHWRTVVRFIADNVAWLWERRGVTIEAPRIEPGPAKSIDLHWQTDAFEMLVNIPAENGAAVQFYGDDVGGVHLKGNLDLSRDNFWLFLWMAARR